MAHNFYLLLLLLLQYYGQLVRKGANIICGEDYRVNDLTIVWLLWNKETNQFQVGLLITLSFAVVDFEVDSPVDW